MKMPLKYARIHTGPVSGILVLSGICRHVEHNFTDLQVFIVALLVSGAVEEPEESETKPEQLKETHPLNCSPHAQLHL